MMIHSILLIIIIIIYLSIYTGTLQISGLPPFTYDAMISAGLTTEEIPLMNGNIARILCDQLVKDKSSAGGAPLVIPDDLLSILNEVKEVKKKNKTKKGASKENSKAVVAGGEA